jgi:GTPase Era involved in 16S rRNA processing
VLGSGGSMIKRIGQTARKSKTWWHKVYLELWVKVGNAGANGRICSSNWRRKS